MMTLGTGTLFTKNALVNLNKMSKANGTNKQRRFWLPTSEKFGSEGSSPSLIHSYLLLCAFLTAS